MSLAGVLYLVLGFSAGASVVAAVIAKFFLPPIDERAGRTDDPKPESSEDKQKTDGADSLAIRHFGPGVAESPAPKNVQDQLAFAADLWPQLMPWMSSEDWREATKGFGTLPTGFAQDRLDLTVPHLNYMQIAERTSQVHIEKILYAAGRSARPA